MPQGFLGHITVGHVPIELSRYIFFAGQHGCSFVVKVEQSKPVVSPLVQGGLEIVCNVTAIWTSRPGLNKLRMFVEEHYSVDKNDIDDSKAILEDLKGLLNKIEDVSGSDSELEVNEDADIVMIEDSE